MTTWNCRIVRHRGPMEWLSLHEDDEKVVRDRLIATTLPRTLDRSRQKSLTAVLKPFAGQRFRAAISSSADDGPAFWASLHEVLQNAGWIYVPPSPGDYTIGRPPAGVPISSIPGVEILFNPGKELQLLPAALALGNALHTDGTVVEVNRDLGLQQDSALQEVIFIRIGARPPRQ